MLNQILLRLDEIEAIIKGQSSEKGILGFKGYGIK